MTTTEILQKIRNRTAEIVKGEIYWLSSFYEKDGAYVRVLEASTKTNHAGWPSTVLCEVVEPIGDCATREWYKPNVQRICNATNLYENRNDSSHASKYAHLAWYKSEVTA
jgi:hypothetical protein